MVEKDDIMVEVDIDEDDDPTFDDPEDDDDVIAPDAEPQAGLLG